MQNKERFTARFLILAAALCGKISLLLFVIFLFLGSFGLFARDVTDTRVLVWDAMLSMAFFIQHSCMIRRSFRDFLSKIIQPHYLDSVFTIVSGTVLSLVVLFWLPTAAVVTELGGFARLASRLVFVLALVGLGWGAYSLKSFDPFGRKPIKAYLKGIAPKPQPFEVYGPYLWVRHPLYFFVLLLIWSFPDLTLDRLLFNVLWTVWIYLGAILEERDLIAAFGEPYRAYQKKVPMLIPWKRPLWRKTS